MNFLASIKIAFKALLSNKLRSFLTMLGIIIGVSSVIALVSIGSGLKETIAGQVNSLGSDQIYVIPGDVSEGGGFGAAAGFGLNKLAFSDADYLKERLTGYAGVVPIAESYATLRRDNKELKQVDVIATTAECTVVVDDKITSGQFFTAAHEKGAARVAVVGPAIRNELFNGNDPLGQQITINSERYTVVGELEQRGALMGVDQDRRAYIPYTAMRAQGVRNPTTILIKVAEGESIPKLADATKRVLRQRYSSGDFSVMTQDETLEMVDTILGSVSAALVGIAAISLLVGGIGISNIMLVSVTERTREIGLRKALGARPRDIRNQFLIEAVTLTVVGGLIGVVIGYAAGILLNQFVPSLEPVISTGVVLLAAGFSAAVGVIFGVFPALRASRLDPIVALRYE